MASDSISLARWWRALLRRRDVSEASLTEMSTFYDNATSITGSGCSIPRTGTRRAWAHGSQLRLQLGVRVHDRRPLIVVVLTNLDVDIFDLGATLVLAARSE